MNRILNAFLSLTMFVVFSSCEDSINVEPIESKDGKGVFILNQGNFQFSNSSLSFYDPINKQLQNKVFYRANEIPLGDVAQSMAIKDSLAYIVLNNSGSIYVMNINTFEYVAWITGLTSPRFIHFISNEKAYVSDLYAEAISIINPQTFELIGQINTKNNSGQFNQHATEQMVQINNLVYTNCWSFDNKILIIDSNTDKLVDSIEVGLQPVSMVLDNDKKLWVLTDGGYEGNPFGHEKPKLLCINTTTKEIENEFVFNLSDRPTDLKINGTKDTLYLVNNHVYRHVVTDVEFSQTPFVNSENKLFVSLGIDPISSDVYISDAIDYMQSGRVYRYTARAQVIDTLTVGIVPGFFCFKQ